MPSLSCEIKANTARHIKVISTASDQLYCLEAHSAYFNKSKLHFCTQRMAKANVIRIYSHPWRLGSSVAETPSKFQCEQFRVVKLQWYKLRYGHRMISCHIWASGRWIITGLDNVSVASSVPSHRLNKYPWKWKFGQSNTCLLSRKFIWKLALWEINELFPVFFRFRCDTLSCDSKHLSLQGTS